MGAAAPTSRAHPRVVGRPIDGRAAEWWRLSRFASQSVVGDTPRCRHVPVAAKPCECLSHNLSFSLSSETLILRRIVRRVITRGNAHRQGPRALSQKGSFLRQPRIGLPTPPTLGSGHNPHVRGGSGLRRCWRSGPAYRRQAWHPHRLPPCRRGRLVPAVPVPSHQHRTAITESPMALDWKAMAARAREPWLPFVKAG